MTILLEGGNVFKSEDKTPLTRRILTSEIPATIAWLEKISMLDFTMDKDEADVPIKWLGTTGRKLDKPNEPGSSGDLDLSVDENEISKEDLVSHLADWCKRVGVPEDKILNGKKDKTNWIEKTGDSVHFRCPIKGDPENGFAQADFMFTSDPKFQQFSMRGGGDVFKGMHRHLLMASIAKANGLKWSYKSGLVSRTTDETVSKDPDHIAEILLGPGSTSKDLQSVETILVRIKKLPNYEELIKDFKDALARDPSGPQLDESRVNTMDWFRSVINKIS
jgi:hypothetical protein